MKIMWWWLKKNSEQLQALASVVAILGALAAIPYFASKWLEPDLAVTVARDEVTTPPALKDWIRDVSFELKSLPEPEAGKPDPYLSLRKLQASGPLKPGRFETFRTDELSRIRIDVTNQTNRVMPGVRLRLDPAWPVWGIILQATFLTPDEITRWHKSLPAERSEASLVLPELPPLPPRSSVSLVAYGDVATAEVAIAVPGSSFNLVRTVEVEDKWPISAVLRPHWIPLAFLLGVLFFLIILSVFERQVWRRANSIIPYSLACREARAGRQESALSLLEASVAAGYKDFRHMSGDPDLASLQNLDSFKDLCRLGRLSHSVDEEA